MNPPASSVSVDAIDRKIIAATQAGLPLCGDPYARIAERVGTTERDVMRRLRLMMANGVIRRIGAVPNHYRLGYRANGMSVWDVADEQVTLLGNKVGALSFVTHCYRRPRHLPDWPYNLFAMVHGRSRDEVDDHIAEISTLLGTFCRRHDVLFSTRILKKAGLRIAA